MIKPLTSLRFFFAFIVFLAHLGFLAESQNESLKAIHKELFLEGFLGVSFFFILSGFILTYSYKDKIVENKISYKEFWVARFARIYPLHIFTLFLAIPFIYLATPTSPFLWLITLIANFTLTHSFFPIQDIFYSLNKVSWSISTEAFFYLMFPFLIHFLYKGKRRDLIIKVIFPIILCTFPFLVKFVPDTINYWFFYINPFSRIIDFIIGIFLYRLYIIYKDSVTTAQGNLLEICSTLILILFIGLRTEVPHLYRLSCYYWLPMSFVILSFSLNKGIISSILSRRFFTFLGEISFAFYLIHQIIIHYFSMFYSKYTFWNNDYINVISLFLLSVFISYLLYTYIEVPLNKKVKYYLSGEIIKYKIFSFIKLRV